VTLGQVVISRAGRDVGRKFIVINVVDNIYVQISDGELRRIEKPKKKKIKHLEPTGQFAEAVLEKLKNSSRISNSDIRKALAGVEGTLENKE
jgi:ribosomal protein L14E/L6E/L27E